MKVYIAPKFKGNEYGGIPRVVEAQYKWLPEFGCEVVEDPSVCDILVMHATAWIEPLAYQKVITHCHGLYWSDYQWPKWAHMVNHDVSECIRRADACTAPSEWVANAIRRGTNRLVDVIGHGVDLDEWEVSKHNNYVLWDKTRADPVCDPRVVNVIATKMPNVRFVTSIGDEDANVEVIGIQPYSDHKEWIKHATLYLCTARETFGIGTIEAMACGVPIVGWDWGGQQDIVTPDCGRLVPLGDYDALKEAINYCIINRDRLSDGARSVVEDKYQWKDVVKQYANLYASLILDQQTKRVSVIIPSYNLSTYLPKAIESVVSQLGDDDELIIVDDNSTDNSFTVAKAYATNNVRIVRTPNNLYLSGALNYGIGLARGRYILPLDADNTLGDGSIGVLAGELDKSLALDIVYGKVRFINDDGTPYQSQITDEEGISKWPPGVFNYEQQMAHRNQIPSTSMYRRSVWDHIGGYRRRCRTAEDADFWCRATSYGARAHKVTDMVTLVYTNRETSMSHTVKDWPWEEWYSNVRPFIITGDNPQVPDPIVSVIIPVGPGHGEWVTDALDSLVNQTFSDWECIVVNDTGEEIRWLPSWVRKLSTSALGSGVSVSRNIGIQASRGNAFVLLDADDFLEPEALQDMYTAYRTHGGYVYTDWYNPDTRAANQITGSCQDLRHNLIHPITCMFPSEVKQHCSFDESMKYGEDWDYILSVVENGWCGTYVPKPLLYYRQGYGKNRQALKDNIDTVRSKMQEKYTVGCSCGRGGGAVAQSMPLGAVQQQSNDLVLIEYTKTDQATITYRGPNTGTEYRFGNNEGHKLGYVHTVDLEWFLNRLEFRLADLVPVS